MIAILRTGQVIEAPTLSELFDALKQMNEVPRCVIKRRTT